LVVTQSKVADIAINRVSEIENQIGAGLIEEVVAVAEGELRLVDVMAESKV
jgi:NADH dehydrogenase (ubiquinone) 1 alpha subcomplex subunit 5